MEKMSMSEAKKMLREGYWIMHISWFSEKTGWGILHNVDLEKENPDCSHALIAPCKKWREPNAVAALILDNPETRYHRSMDSMACSFKLDKREIKD